jgi:DUF2950 family protein
MRSISARRLFSKILWITLGAVGVWAPAAALAAGAQTPAKTTPAVDVTSFGTPQQAADALVGAAEQFDVRALEDLLGRSNLDLVLSGEYADDQQRAAKFVAAAHEKKSVSVDPHTPTRAVLIVGNEDWPFPIPLIKQGTRWSFNGAAGRQELLNRRIGSNELDAIAICRGYVDAQHEYALQPREGYSVPQYAQRIISTPGKRDGLAWQLPDGTWGGPVGEEIARAIEQGYNSRTEPYHGYFFKVLKGQGPAAPLGQMDFVVQGAMIGGFALIAAPAEYGVTGVKSFIVSHDGVVYEKDLGPASLDELKKAERFNPDRSWTPVLGDAGD